MYKYIQTHIYVARTEYTGWLHTCSVVPVGVISGAFFCPLPECQDSRHAPPSPVLSSNAELWADKSSSLSTVLHSQPLKRSSSEQIYKHINIRNTYVLIISFLLASEKKLCLFLLASMVGVIWICSVPQRLRC